MMCVPKAHLIAEVVLEPKHHQDDSGRARKHVCCLLEAVLCLEQLRGNNVQLLVRASQQRLQVIQVLRKQSTHARMHQGIRHTAGLYAASRKRQLRALKSDGRIH